MLGNVAEFSNRWVIGYQWARMDTAAGPVQVAQQLATSVLFAWGFHVCMTVSAVQCMTHGCCGKRVIMC